ncbi:MAG TPA: hypothetical protein VEW48_00105 [Thermoanaerobaculia bacterium]|nr:hypothetical protein [Thermoanaerobaculia bacterium]
MSPKLRSILPVLLLTLAACGGGREEPAQPTEAPAAPEPAVPIAPITSRGTAPSDAGTTADIDFTLPSGWTSETPSSGMRLAQASIPGPGGPGQLAVFYFGPGGGGDVDSNIQRWVGQMEPDPGVQPAREAFETKNGFRVTWVDVAGTLKASPMGGPASPQPGSRLLGAVVEGPGGPWFFKATGPKATLDPERDHFLEMLRGVHPK